MEAYTLNALAELTGYDRKVIRRALADVKPAGRKGKFSTYYLKNFIEALIKLRSPDSLDLATERALLARAQREKCDLQTAILAKEHIPVCDVRQLLANAAMSIRRVIVTSSLSSHEQDSILAELRALKAESAGGS